MMKSMLINLSLFKLGWVACVLLAASGRVGAATAVAGIVVVLHLARVAVPVKEALFISIAALIGLAWESVVMSTGLLQYSPSGAAGALPPHWIVAMWALFATTVGHGLEWIKRNWMLCSGFGAVGGPLAFLSGSATGAVTFTDPVAAMALIGLGWSLLLPLLAWISDTIVDSPFLEPAARPATVPARPRKLAGGERQQA